jgi:hypothetical protein
MTKTHHYAKNGRKYGPVSVRELQTLLQNGRLAPTDLVWTEGMPDWKPAAEISELSPAANPATATRRDHAPPRSQPAPAEQLPTPSASAGPTSVPVAAGAVSSPSSRAVEHFRRFLSGARQTAIVTGQHAARLFACGMAQGKIGLARREAVRTLATLGQKMHGAGLGTQGSRRAVEELEERIRSLKAAGSSSRPLERELGAAHAALAESALESNQAPSGLATEFEAARSARNALHAVQSVADDARSSLRSMHAQQGLRIAAGYLCLFLLFSAIAWASRGTGAPAQRSPDAAQNGGDPAGGGGNEPIFGETTGGYAPGAGNATQKSTCSNCNGTGQANCLQCFGTGKRSCFNCNSTGRTPNNLLCFQCNGTGRQNCSFCQFGRVQCPQCFGSGQR